MSPTRRFCKTTRVWKISVSIAPSILSIPDPHNMHVYEFQCAPAEGQSVVSRSPNVQSQNLWKYWSGIALMGQPTRCSENAVHWIRQHVHFFCPWTQVSIWFHWKFHGCWWSRSFDPFRLWIQSKGPDDPPGPQQLGYLNVVPACTSPPGMFKSPTFENFGQTVTKLNEMFKQNPLPGKHGVTSSQPVSVIPQHIDAVHWEVFSLCMALAALSPRSQGSVFLSFLNVQHKHVQHV